MSIRYAIGDIHGCYKTFCYMLDEVIKLKKEDVLYILGDMIDRGTNSRGVIDRIIEMQSKGFCIKPIMGNHEYLLNNAVLSTDFMHQWLKNGCKTTLSSFEVVHPRHLDQKYLDFFSSLEYYYETDDCLLVHGGLNFKLENPLSDTTSMIWERNSYVDLDKIGGKTRIVGHTPRSIEFIENNVKSKHVFLDGGCVYYSMQENLGNLVAMNLDTREILYNRNIDYDDYLQ